MLLLAGFLAVERRAAAPMVRPAILRHRPLAGANLAIIANAGGFTGMMFMATLYMQQVLGYGALEAGARLRPLALMATAGGLAAPRLIDRAGPRRTATISLAVTAAAFLFLARVPVDDGYLPVVLPGFVVAGFSFATAFVPLTSQGMTGVREGEKGLASGLFHTSTHLGGALVLAILATAAAARTEAARAADETARIVMAANEAWQNAIEHGHDFAPVPVSVRFAREDDDAVITVRDAGGRGMPPGDPDRGRGIALMRGLTDDTRLDLGSHRGGVAVLRRRIGVPAPGAAARSVGGAAA